MEDVTSLSEAKIKPDIPLRIHLEGCGSLISERGSEPDIISFTGYRHIPQIFKKTDKRNPSNLFQFHNPLIYHKTNADSILGMAMSETSAPQETLTQGSRQCHTVGKVQFHLQRQGTAVHKGIAVFRVAPS